MSRWTMQQKRLVHDRAQRLMEEGMTKICALMLAQDLEIPVAARKSRACLEKIKMSSLVASEIREPEVKTATEIPASTPPDKLVSGFNARAEKPINANSVEEFWDKLFAEYHVIPRIQKIAKQPSVPVTPAERVRADRVMIVGLMPQHHEEIRKTRPDIRFDFFLVGAKGNGVDTTSMAQKFRNCQKAIILPWVPHQITEPLERLDKKKIFWAQRGLSSLKNYILTL